MSRLISVSVFVLLLSFALSSAAQVQAQTVDEIISRHVAATGGIERWRSLQSLTIISRSEHFSFNCHWKRPDRIRVDVLLDSPLQGADIRSFDGAAGWRINPIEGSEEPRQMSAREIAELRAEADWLKELIDYKAKGHRVELVGEESIDGNPAYRLKVMRASGAIIHILLDVKTALEVKRVQRLKSPWGEELEQATVIGDYRWVKGLLLPHRVGPAVREYEVDQPKDDAFFMRPQKKAGAEQSGKEGARTNGSSTQAIERVADPERRAQILRTNPEADVNRDGVLSLEEAWAWMKKDRTARRLLPVGSVAPDWTLKDAQGRPHRLSDYRGKVVVLDFWAVWCIPCLRAMPGLQRLHEDLTSRGVVVFGISTREEGGDPVQLMKDRGYTYGLLLNGETIAEQWHVEGLPTIYVIGIDGRIIDAGFGANEIAEQRRRSLIEDYLTKLGK